MCGIFGFTASKHSTFERQHLSQLLNRLFVLSEKRGKDASGLAVLEADRISVLKRPQRARTLVNSSDYASLLSQYAQRNAHHEEVLTAMGHARMVTNGSEEKHYNNQPVIKHGMVCLLNGIVVNDAQLWEEYPSMQREFVADTEVILSLIDHFRTQENMSYLEAVREMFQHIQGGNSIALLTEEMNGVVMGTVNGSLYMMQSPSCQELIFASERYMLEQIRSHPTIKHIFADMPIQHVPGGHAYAFSFEDMQPYHFELTGKRKIREVIKPFPQKKSIYDIEMKNPPPERKLAPPLSRTQMGNNDAYFGKVQDSIRQLRRCTRCVLPETFPLIEFDEEGVCNICRNHQPLNNYGRDALEELVAPVRAKGKQYDCLVPLSGGRDSCYGLHFIKKELGLKPVAYSYDWGMVTDLARRNIYRMCGELEVEHILISADIKSKRENVRKNVTAWLRDPQLGTVPLFMAGDKQFFYFASALRRQMDLDFIFFNMNRLEVTDFKTGFSGVLDHSKQDRKIQELSDWNKMRLMLYYGSQFVKNPSYLNTTLWDTFFAFIFYYVLPQDFYILYDYIPWNENMVEDVLIPQYDWELATDTESTWRIGDATAPFYNYIYYVMGGLTENDTFRSKQIREGMIDRETALDLIYKENLPRYESMQWYCNAVNIDLNETLKVINNAPKRYEMI